MRAAWALVAVAGLSLSCARKYSSVTSTAQAPVKAVMDRQVINAVDAGDGDLVVRGLRQRIAADPADLSARLKLAAHYESLGFPELAIEHYRLAMERFPDNSKVALLLAESLEKAGQGAAAVEALEAFAVRHPSLEVQASAGMTADSIGEHSRAERAHRAALGLADREPSARQARLHNNLGYNLLLQSRREEAIHALRHSLGLDPRLEIARHNLAAALARGDEKERNEARLYWQSLIGPAGAHNNVAAALIEQGDFAGARSELDLALGYSRDFAPALHNLALVSELDGRTAQIRINSDTGRRYGLMKRIWFAVAGIEPKAGHSRPALAASQ